MLVLRTGLCLLLALYHVTMIVGAGYAPTADISQRTAEQPDTKGQAAGGTEAPLVPQLTAAPNPSKRTLLPAALQSGGSGLRPRTAITSVGFRPQPSLTATATLYLDHCALLC